jgi:hypothetical protein
MKIRAPREPFFGVAEFDGIVPGLELRTSMGDGSADEAPVQFHGHDPSAPSVPQDTPTTHPDYCEKGIELPLGFIPHQGESRTQRRAAVANFQADGVDRRELWLQRQRQRRGKLDPELRRLQRKRLKAN